METLNFLSLLWGFSIVIVALALCKSKNVQALFGLIADERILLLAGMINIVFGLFLVLTYNVWSFSWGVIVTILGWLVIARGSLILFFPNAVKNTVAKYKESRHIFKIILTAALILGIFLILKGLGAL